MEESNAGVRVRGRGRNRIQLAQPHLRRRGKARPGRGHGRVCGVSFEGQYEGKGACADAGRHAGRGWAFVPRRRHFRPCHVRSICRNEQGRGGTQQGPTAERDRTGHGRRGVDGKGARGSGDRRGCTGGHGQGKGRSDAGDGRGAGSCGFGGQGRSGRAGRGGFSDVQPVCR